MVFVRGDLARQISGNEFVPRLAACVLHGADSDLVGLVRRRHCIGQAGPLTTRRLLGLKAGFSVQRRSEARIGAAGVIDLDQLGKGILAVGVRLASVGLELGIQQRSQVQQSPSPGGAGLGRKPANRVEHRNVGLFRARVGLGLRAARGEPILVQLHALEFAGPPPHVVVLFQRADDLDYVVDDFRGELESDVFANGFRRRPVAPIELAHHGLGDVLEDAFRIGEPAGAALLDGVPLHLRAARQRRGPEAAPGECLIHADFRKTDQRQPGGHGPRGSLGKDQVGPRFLRGKRPVQALPLTLVEEPRRQDDPDSRQLAAGQRGHPFRGLEEPVAPPGAALLAAAAALIVGPYPHVVRLKIGCPIELSPQDVQNVLHAAGFAGANRAVVPSSPSGARVGPQLRRGVVIGLVGNHSRNHVQSDAFCRRTNGVQTVAERHRLGIVMAVEMVHVVPKGNCVVAPQPEVLHVALDFFDGRIVVEVVKMGGEIDAADGFLRDRNAAPRARREAALVVAAGPQELAHAVEHAALVVAGDPHTAAGPVFDAKAFRADARCEGQLDRNQRVARSNDLGRAPLLDLAGEDLADVLDHRRCIGRKHQPDRFRRRGMQWRHKPAEDHTEAK